MEKIKVYLIVILVMFFWGLNIVGIKTVVTYMDALTMTAIRISIAAIIVLTMLYIMKKLRKVSQYELKWLVIGSVLGVFIHHILLAVGIENTTATNSSIIVGFSPLLTMVFALIFGFSKFNLIQFLGFILGLWGIVVAVTKGFNVSTSFAIGDIIVFLSIASQCLSFLVIRKLSNSMDSMLITGYLLLIGAGMLLITSLLFNFNSWKTLHEVSPVNYLIVLLSALLATAVGQTLYNYAISKIGPAETAIFTNFNTIFALLASSMLLNETILMVQIIGCILIIIGVLFGTGSIQEIIRNRRKVNNTDI